MSGPADPDAARAGVLSAALAQVAFDGWTDATLAAAGRAAGLDALTVARAFPGGVAELVEYFGEWADGRMAAALGAAQQADMRVRERVAFALRARFEVLMPHREAVRRAVAFLSLPHNAPRALRAALRTTDAVWWGIGDASADFNYYTKRALLLGVLGATTLYWLEDRSPGCAASWGFLDRRIDDALTMGRLPSRLSGLFAARPGRFRRKSPRA